MLTTDALDELLSRYLAGERHLFDEMATRCEPALMRFIDRALWRRARRR